MVKNRNGPFLFPELTVVIPVLNEEQHLGHCLKALKGFCPVLVIDSGSVDNTLNIAREYGVPVIPFSWNGRYPKKKNWVLEQKFVDTEWILFLDADEFLTDAFKEEIVQLLPTTSHNGFWLTFENFFIGKPLRHGIPFRKLFLMRKGTGKFQRVEDEGWTGLDMEIHEQLEVSGTVGIIKSPIIHDNDKGLSHFLQKHREYARWEARRHLNSNELKDPSFRQKVKFLLLDSYILGPVYFLANYICYLGFLDGWAGLKYSYHKAAYFINIKKNIDAFRKESV